MKGISYSEDFIKIKSGIDLQKDNLIRALLTTFGERVQTYSFGSRFGLYIFEFAPVIEQDIKREFNRIVSNYVSSDYTVSGFSLKKNEDNSKLTLEFSIMENTSLKVKNVSQEFVKERT